MRKSELKIGGIILL